MTKHLPIIGWERFAMMHLTLIYESEINFSICTFWDGGFTARLGDYINGFKDEAQANVSFQDAVEELITIVLNHYPDSTYAKWYKGEPIRDGYSAPLADFNVGVKEII